MDAVTPLADDFPAPDLAAWRVLAEKALKGAPLDRLTWRTADGIAVQPLYTAGDAPAAERALRPTLDADRPWDLRTIVAHPSPARANAQALQDLEGGAASILLKLDPTGREGVVVRSAEDMAAVLAGVYTDLAPVALDAGFLGPQAAEQLSLAAGRGPAAPLAFHLDPLSAFARAGASPGPMRAHLAQAAETAARLAEPHPAASLMLASGRVVHEAGGTEAQELGFAAACALAYARALEAAGLPRAAALRGVTLSLAADPRHFVSIAKLRALRLIWSRIATALGAPEVPARIEARGAERTLSRLDPWTNLLRLTAAAFGAAVGGADAIVIPPFTQPLTEGGRGTASNFARRQARNTQLVLMEESHLGRVADPAGGAWFIERLTADFAQAGWRVMQAIETQGGALAALQAGGFASEVAAARGALAQAAATRRSELIGVSAFPNVAETGAEIDPLPELAPGAPADGRLPGPDDACAALAPWRMAEPFERLRARQLSRPAYLVLLGSAAEAGARAGFARSLLAAGGVHAEQGALDAYDPAESRLAVLCGTDARYADEAAAAARALKAAGVSAVWLAGKPGEAEAALRAAGVDGFLYAGCDAPAVLQELQDIA